MEEDTRLTQWIIDLLAVKKMYVTSILALTKYLTRRNVEEQTYI